MTLPLGPEENRDVWYANSRLGVTVWGCLVWGAGQDPRGSWLVACTRVLERGAHLALPGAHAQFRARLGNTFATMNSFKPMDEEGKSTKTLVQIEAAAKASKARRTLRHARAYPEPKARRKFRRANQ